MLAKLDRQRLLVASAFVVAVIAAGCWFALGTRPSATSVIIAEEPDERAPAKIKEGYGNLPLSFEPNRGQTDSRVKFLARGSGCGLFLTTNEVALNLRDAGAASHPTKTNDQRSTVVRMGLVGANASPQIAGLEELPGKSNYFIGNDPRRWRKDIPTYAKVKYEAVYPEVDLIYYGTQGRELEYDFIVAPQADPKAIRLSFEGVDKLEVDGQGDLALHHAGKQLRMRKPIIYQESDGARQEVAGYYARTGEREVGFEIASYDETRPLVIDPILVYSTYLGGSGADVGQGIAVNAHGSAFVIAATTSLNFPTEPTGTKLGPGGGRDAVVSRLNAAGNLLIYSTYLGGSADENYNEAYNSLGDIAVGSDGSAYVTGVTKSSNFPVFPKSVFQASLKGSADAYVTKLNPSGKIVYSTFLGGSGFDAGQSIAVDTSGNAYVTVQEESGDFQIIKGFQPKHSIGCATTSGFAFKDGLVAKLNAAGSDILYSTYLGGNHCNLAFGIAVDARQNAYVVGETQSTNLLVTNGSIFRGGVGDIFVAKLDTKLSGLPSRLYFTYLGGSGNERLYNHGIAIDSASRIYVTGGTDSTDFPTEPPESKLNTGADTFVVKLDITKPGNQIVYSILKGGGGEDSGSDIAVDLNDNAYVVGRTYGTFPTTPGLSSCSESGVFVMKVKTDGSVIYSACLSGLGQDDGHDIAVDPAGCAYLTGLTESSNYPTVNALQSAFGGGLPIRDAFVTKLCDGLDHFKCYNVQTKAPFKPFRAQLRDQFETQWVWVLRPETLCNPVIKCVPSGNPAHPLDCARPVNPDAHLTCYRTTDQQGTPQFGPREVIVSNQFGQQQRLTVWRRRNLLCLPSLKAHVDDKR